MERIKPFAQYGTEKMLYDLRMGPQLVKNGNYLYCVYQANKEGIYSCPFITRYSINENKWEGPFKIGECEEKKYDHHQCPVLWLDADGYIHVLYDCHGGCGAHVVSIAPYTISAWRRCGEIYSSISYPHIIRYGSNNVCLYFRAFGHMGFWAYTISNDGGFSWSKPIGITDFDQRPENDQDTWAGSYHSVDLSPDGHILHIAFTYFDERGIWKYVHPRYKRMPSVNTRYNTYYLQLDLATGVIRNDNGKEIESMLSRKEAEIAKIWDSGDYLTMQPAILSLPDNSVSFLLPVTGKTEWDCTFFYLKKTKGKWRMFRVCDTNTTWSGCRLAYKDGVINAYLISGKTDGSIYTYGAGELEKWESFDDGETWKFSKRFVPEKGDLYNNPIIAEDSMNSGRKYSEFIAFYGWTGPYSIQPVIDKKTDIPIINRGKAYLIVNDDLI